MIFKAGFFSDWGIFIGRFSSSFKSGEFSPADLQIYLKVGNFHR
jgi:hypothetical protein